MTTENNIDDVITAFIRDHGRPDVITGWVTLVAVTTIDTDGTESSGIETIMSGGNLPWINALGIIEAARIRMHHQFVAGVE